MVDRIRWDTVSYLPFYYIFFEIDFQFLLLTIFNLQARLLAIKDILSNLVPCSVQGGIFFTPCERWMRVDMFEVGRLGEGGRRVPSWHPAKKILVESERRKWEGVAPKFAVDSDVPRSCSLFWVVCGFRTRRFVSKEKDTHSPLCMLATLNLKCWKFGF